MDVLKLRAVLGLDTSEYDDKLKDAESGANKVGQAINSAMGTVAKVTLAGVTATATGVGVLMKNSIDAYAEYEQLVGGVETLFKDSSDKVMEYAENAYKTAGLSANEYMDTVTSFSASLLQSLDGDTELATEVANRAITDMADNANKMGTSMESIQTAYQGFAKQNYTMLDNLKLGYGGTQAEMQRLIEDASKLTDVQEELGIVVEAGDLSFGNIANAISVVQKNMGIMGTTALEAEETISGSIGMLKSSWENLITGMANSEADISQLIENVLDAGKTVIGNLTPVVGQVLQGIADSIDKLGPVISTELPQLIDDILPPLLEVASEAFIGIVNALPTLFESIINVIPTLLKSLLPSLVVGVTNLISSLAKQLPKLMKSIIKVIPEIVSDICDALADEFPKIESIFNSLSAVVEGLFGFISDNGDTVISMLKGILVAFVSYQAVTSILTTITTAIGTVSTAIKTLQVGMLALSANPITLIATAVGVLAGAMIYAQSQSNTLYHSIADLTDEQQKLNDAAKEYNAYIGNFVASNQEVITSIDTQYASEKALLEELKGITDENGKVKERYQERAGVIVNELAEAFGIEITYQDGVIAKYDEVMAKIDEVIEKKKAEALLSAGQDEYTQALSEQKEMYESVKATQDDLAIAQENYAKAQEHYNEVNKDFLDYASYGSSDVLNPFIFNLQNAETELQASKDKVENLSASLEEQSEAFYNNQAVIENYEKLQEAVSDGTDDLSQSITNMTNNLMTNAPIEFLQEQASEAKKYYQEILDDFQSGEVALSEEQVEQAKAYSDEAARILHEAYDDYFIEGENAINGYIEGFESGAENSATSASDMVEEHLNAIRKAQDSHSPAKEFMKEGKNAIDGYIKGFESRYTALNTSSTNEINSLAKIWNYLKNNSSSWGSDFISNFENGIRSRLNSLLDTVRNLASQVRSYLHFSVPDKGPLADADTWMPDMMELFAEGIRDNESVVTNQIKKSFDFGRIGSFDNLDFGSMSTNGFDTASGFGSIFNQTINVNREISTADELARAVRIESRYGLMTGGALG